MMFRVTKTNGDNHPSLAPRHNQVNPARDRRKGRVGLSFPFYRCHYWSSSSKKRKKPKFSLGGSIQPFLYCENRENRTHLFQWNKNFQARRQWFKNLTIFLQKKFLQQDSCNYSMHIWKYNKIKLKHQNLFFYFQNWTELDWTIDNHNSIKANQGGPSRRDQLGFLITESMANELEIKKNKLWKFWLFQFIRGLIEHQLRSIDHVGIF